MNSIIHAGGVHGELQVAMLAEMATKSAALHVTGFELQRVTAFRYQKSVCRWQHNFATMATFHCNQHEWVRQRRQVGRKWISVFMVYFATCEKTH